MNVDIDFANNLLNYINTSPTAYHAVSNAADLLSYNGFMEIKEQQPWKLIAEGKYYLRKNNSAIVAFIIGSENLAENGFRIIGAHTDSPNLKVKPGNCIITPDGYVKLNVEVYGGVILSTWFDRPLSIAGRVIIKKDKIAQEKYVNIHKPLFIIPNLCIHFQRDVNENCSYNKQTDILPLIGIQQKGEEKENYLLQILREEVTENEMDILDYELFLYDYTDGIFMGAGQEFISASRLDNLSMVYTGLQGLMQSSNPRNTKVFVAFDNEEVGSTSAAGANSALLHQILNRISKNLGINDDACFQAIANSTSISADTAHAVHPNYSDKHDIQNRPILGGGPVIKYSANQKYATTSVSAAYFMQACEKCNVPYQKFVMRNDMTGGSTIGPASSSLTTIPTVDMGTPILAMHSIRELGSVIDDWYTRLAFTSYYDCK